jgi:hypothetical protein
MDSVRWNIAVSPDTDQSVRMFIAAQGGGRKGDLSHFIEDKLKLVSEHISSSGDWSRKSLFL